MILLTPVEFSDFEELEQLRHLLSDEFCQTVNISPPMLRVEKYYDPARRQYYSSAIIKDLVDMKPQSAEKALAVTQLDLYIPILTFVFGEAQLNGPCAVVSSMRLDNTFYGLPADSELLMERLYKEAVHELGHTWGLIHCREPECIMRSSTYVEEIDLKTSAFCPSCKKEFNDE